LVGIVTNHLSSLVLPKFAKQPVSTNDFCFVIK